MAREAELLALHKRLREKDEEILRLQRELKELEREVYRRRMMNPAATNGPW